MAQTFFKRNEKKYLLSPQEYAAVERLVEQHMAHDAHFHSSIYNVYFDTAHDDLIVASLDNPDYKYKVRARSYGNASKDKVFLEIKSKLNGTVYKRRAVLTHKEYAAYLATHSHADSQVMREVDRLFTQKALVPKMFVAYDRTAYTAKDGSDLRITFDAGLRSRAHSLQLTDTAQSTPYFADGTRIMEVKTKHGMPLWLTSALTSHRIYPSSFSKYGKIYQQYTTRSLTHA